MTRLRRAWRRVRALSWGQRGQLMQAWLLLALVGMGLRLFGLRRVRTVLRLASAGDTGRDDLPAAQAVARIVQYAAAGSPGRPSCLTRSLVLCWMLRRRGLGAHLRIGVARPGGRFAAHAWVEHAGLPLTESQPSGTCYTAFDEALLKGNSLIP
jgi:hypothetical protein